MCVETRENKMKYEFECTEEITEEVIEAEDLSKNCLKENFYLIQNIILINSEEVIESCE